MAAFLNIWQRMFNNNSEKLALMQKLQKKLKKMKKLENILIKLWKELIKKSLQQLKKLSNGSLLKEISALMEEN